MKSFDKDFAVALGKAIQHARIEAQMTQKALRLAAGISKNQLSRYERGEAVPSSLHLARLCKGLGVSSHQLLPGVVD